MAKLNIDLWKNEPVICLTFDVDWASEETLRYSYNIIEKYSYKPTFFLTHKSQFLSDLIDKKYIDSGIHPNFLPDSSQGSNYDEIIDYCTRFLPNAKSFRCHRYFDVNDITEVFIKKGFKYDSNLCTFLERVEPFLHRSGLIRFPIFFEDGAYLFHKHSLNFKKVGKQLFYKEGLAILNIHPMHIGINSPNFNYMREIKDRLSWEEWNRLDLKMLKEISYKGYGIRDFVIEILEYIKKENIKTFTLNELYEIVTNK